MPPLKTFAAWLVALPGAVFCAARLAGFDTSYPALQLIAYTPYAVAASLVPVVVALALRQRIAAGAAGLVFLLLAPALVPRATHDGGTAEGREFRVMAANLFAGAGDPVGLLSLVRQENVDVLLLQEYTPQFAAKFSGISEVLPYKVEYAKRSVHGSAIYSRYPLDDDGLRINPPDFGQAKAILTVDGRRIAIESVHTRAPGGTFLPPVTLDHVLADQRFGVRRFAAFHLAGSDHRPILAVLTLPA